jgi:hypothetical protein
VVQEQNQFTKVKDVNWEDFFILLFSLLVIVSSMFWPDTILIYYFQPTMVHAWPLYDAWTACNLELFCRLDQSSELTPA